MIVRSRASNKQASKADFHLKLDKKVRSATFQQQLGFLLLNKCYTTLSNVIDSECYNC